MKKKKMVLEDNVTDDTKFCFTMLPQQRCVQTAAAGGQHCQVLRIESITSEKC